jgi:hypothetical protein
MYSGRNKYIQLKKVFSMILIMHPGLALLHPGQRNWFRKSQLTSMGVIGLLKPYAKTKNKSR